MVERLTSLPLNFPPLVALATEAAQDHTVAFALSCKSDAALWCNIGEESRRARIGAFDRLLSDLTRRESQAVWLGWLARELGMDLPPVGCPGWSRTMHSSGTPETYAGCPMFLFGPAAGGYGFIFGWLGGPWGPRTLVCPALGNPDAPDAPIRALMLAVLTVGSRGAS